MPCSFGSLLSDETRPASWRAQKVMAEDLDGDGRDELVALRSSFVAAFKYGASTAGAIGRLNFDPYPDIVFRFISGDYVVLNGIDGSLIATFSNATQGCSAPTIADITGDGINDVITLLLQGGRTLRSCLNIWSCPIAVMDYDDITNVEEGKVLESLRVIVETLRYTTRRVG